MRNPSSITVSQSATLLAACDDASPCHSQLSAEVHPRHPDNCVRISDIGTGSRGLCDFWFQLCRAVILLAVAMAASGATGMAGATPAAARWSLRRALATARPGAVIHVPAGIYHGPLVITKPVRLLAQPGASVTGDDHGTVVTIKAADVEFHGFTVRGSGRSLDREDAGIKVYGANADIESNALRDVLFGVLLKLAPHSRIVNNNIRGKNLPLPVRGDGIHLWYSNDCLIQDNTITNARDEVIWFSKHVRVIGNTVTDSRYGLHLMYDRHITITDNTLTHNFVGAFLMYSWHIVFERNVSMNNRGVSGYGIGVKNINDLLVRDNRFLNNRIGIYMNSSPSSLGVVDTFRRNVLAYNSIGVMLDPTGQNDVFTENTFMNNTQQVDKDGGGQLRHYRFSSHGRGNFWSNYTGYALGKSDVGAIPYRIQNFFDNLMDEHHRLRLFLYSPAQQAVNLAANAFPQIQPHAVLTDPNPLMQPVAVHAPALIPPHSEVADMEPWILLGIGGLLLGLVGLDRKTAASPVHPADTLAMANLVAPPVEVSAVLHISGLAKAFGHNQVLKALELDVRPGEVVALWGDNGAGKSTTIKCILGLLHYTGDIQVAGMDALRDARAVRRRIGYVPQELSFYSDWDARKTMRFYAQLKRADLESVSALLASVGLADHAKKPVAALSGGMKQRLALAIALLGDPALLLLDEFTSNLDAQARAGLLELLHRQRNKRLAVLFTSHRVDEVQLLADRVLVMGDGRIRADCAPTALGEILGFKKWMRLHFANGDVAAAQRLLAAHGYTVKVQLNTMEVLLSPGLPLDPLRIFLEHGINVTDMETRSHRENESGLSIKETANGN